jgi:thymidine kinase
MSSFEERKLTMVNPIQEGYLEIILGPMFSGKTTQIIQKYNTYTYIGKSVVVINYAEDKRYHDTMLSTHDRKMIPCILADDDNSEHSIYDMWKNPLNNNYESLHNADVILINEGQFFSNLQEIVIDMIDNKNKIVYICGLDGDFNRGRFGDLLTLIPYCDKVTKLNSLCAKCRNGKKGIFSCRITKETSQIVIGSDNYKPLCRSCYKKN